MDKYDKLIIATICLVATFLLLNAVCNTVNKNRIEERAINELTLIFGPELVIFGPANDFDQNKTISYTDVSYSNFKHLFDESTDKTLTVDGLNLLFIRDQDQLIYNRFRIRINVRTGFPMNEYSWYNPFSREKYVYGWLLIETRVVRPNM